MGDQADGDSRGAEQVRVRVQAVTELLRLFRFERTIYVGICVSALLFLFYSGFKLFHEAPDAQAQKAIWLALFLPPSGLIAFAAAAVLRMWSKAMDLVLKSGGQ